MGSSHNAKATAPIKAAKLAPANATNPFADTPLVDPSWVKLFPPPGEYDVDVGVGKLSETKVTGSDVFK